MFDTYARAVFDAGERNRLHTTYRLRNAMWICFLAACVAVIAQAVFLEKYIVRSDPNTAVMVCFGLTIVLWFAFGIAAACYAVLFAKRYRAVLHRETVPEEPPEVTAYRAEQRAARKSIRPAILFCAACVAAGVVLIGVETWRYPDKESFGLLSYIATALMITGFLAVFFFVLLANMRRSQSNLTNADLRKIDKEQGRTPKYALENDRNLQSLRYFFPFPDLRQRAESIRKKYVKAMMIGIIGGVSAAVLSFAVLFSDWLLPLSIGGYAYPVALGLLFASVFLWTFPFTRRMSALEKQQRAAMENDPAFEKNREIYRRYEKYAKGRGKAIYVFLLLSFVVGLVLAICFPDSLVSSVSVLFVFAGLFLNNKFMADLRKSVIPLEEEIDAQEAEAARASETVEDSKEDE